VRGVPAAVFVAVAAVAAGCAREDTGGSPTLLGEVPWQERETKLPAYPNPDRLIRFGVGPTSRFDFFVDPDSLSVGEDGVVRFTVIAKSDHATNVSYEGIRCVTRERKVYATGRPEGIWHAARDPQWVRIGPPTADLHRFVLWNEYFCIGRTPIRTANEGLHALRLGGHPRVQELESGFPIAR
jgi:hypothetical protein